MKKTVMCKLCDVDYKLITQLHLKIKHGTNIRQYQKQFPNAKIRPDYNCKRCKKLVTYRKSSRAKYCKKCANIVNKENVLRNVREYNYKRKKFLQRIFSKANQEHGIQLPVNGMGGMTRIDKTHSAWDFVPNMQNILGSVGEQDLRITDDGRVAAAVRLRKQIEKMKR